MSIKKDVNALKRTARLAGVLILITTVFAPSILLSADLVVPGDARATVNNIRASEGLFRLGIAGQSVIFLVEIGLVAVLYDLFRPVNKTLSLVAALARLAMATIQGTNLLNHFHVLQLVNGSGYLSVFAPEQLEALVLLYLGAYDYVVLIWGWFFGLQLLVLGYLIYRSSYMPRLLGILLVITGLSYLAHSYGTTILPQYHEIFTTIGYLGYLELVFPLWLVIKGVQDRGQTLAKPA